MKKQFYFPPQLQKIFFTIVNSSGNSLCKARITLLLGNSSTFGRASNTVGLKLNVCVFLKNHLFNLRLSEEIRIKKYDPDLLANLTSINGIGKKTAMMLIACTDGFRSFDNAQLSLAYLQLKLLLAVMLEANQELLKMEIL